MRLKSVVFDRDVPIGKDWRKIFRADQGFSMTWLPALSAIHIKAADGRTVTADQTGAAWEPDEEPNGSDQPSEPVSAARSAKQKRQG